MRPNKKAKTTTHSMTMIATTAAKPAGIDGRTTAMKAQPSVSSLSSLSSSESESESESESASLSYSETSSSSPTMQAMTTSEAPGKTEKPPDIIGTDFDSFFSKWKAAASEIENRLLLDELTSGDPFQLTYKSVEEVVASSKLLIEIEEIFRVPPNDKEGWLRLLDERQEVHESFKKIHLESSRVIKEKIKDEIRQRLLKDPRNNSDDVETLLSRENTFLAENVHMLIKVPRNASEAISVVAVENYKQTMMEMGRGKVFESTSLHVSIAGLSQRGLMESDPNNGHCATKRVYFDLCNRVAQEAIFSKDEHKNIDYVLFSISDVLASIGPEHSNATNDGFIPRERVYELHVNQRPSVDGYAGIDCKTVVEQIVWSAEEIAKVCEKHNIFIIVHSAKVRDVLADEKFRERLTIWKRRTLAYSCAPCCHAFGGRARLSSLNICFEMKQRDLGEATLASLSERGSLAFRALEDIIGKEYKKDTLGIPFDGREKDASSRNEEARMCTERIHAHAAELSVDQNKSIINFDALSSAFRSKGGQTTFANQKGIFTLERVEARVKDDKAYPMHDVNNPETFNVLVVMQAWIQYAKSRRGMLVSVNATNPEQELAALREYVQNPKAFLRGKEKIEPTSKRGKWVQVLDDSIKSGEISADNLSYQFESKNVDVGVDILSAGLLNEANAAIIGSVKFNATRPRWTNSHVAYLKSQSVGFKAKVEAELAKWERDGKRRESIAAGARVFNFSLIEETKVHSDPTDKDKKKAMRFPRDAKYNALRKAGMGGEVVLDTADRTKKGNSKKKTTGVGKQEKTKRTIVNPRKKSKYTGVYGKEKSKKYSVMSRKVDIGSYGDEILAAQAYDVFARLAYKYPPKLNEREHPDDFKNLTEEQKLTEEQERAIAEKFKASGLLISTRTTIQNKGGRKKRLQPEAKQSDPLKSLWESHAASKKKKNPPTQSDDEE